MHDYYAARASEYDKVYLKPERQADLRSIATWIETKFINRTILEIACGTGYWTQFIAPTANRVVAIDSAPEVLRVARARLAADKVEFLIGDAYDPPRDRGKFGSTIHMSKAAALRSRIMMLKAILTRREH
jgi:SAM-dependent methyltransferase